MLKNWGAFVLKTNRVNGPFCRRMAFYFRIYFLICQGGEFYILYTGYAAESREPEWIYRGGIALTANRGVVIVHP